MRYSENDCLIFGLTEEGAQELVYTVEHLEGVN
jgi:hypothetical protein